MLFTINQFYIIVGILLATIAIFTLLDKNHPKRLSSGIFWLIYAVIFLVGNWLPDAVVGIMVIVMAFLAGSGKVIGGKHQQPDLAQRQRDAKRFGNKLFIPALTIPLMAIVATLLPKGFSIGSLQLIDPKSATIIGVGLGCILALFIGALITKSRPTQGIHEARRLLDALSWAIVLPQMLAMLGLVFSASGVDTAVGAALTNYINLDYKLIAALIYVLGMALFTIIMGNAFVAFPIIMGGVGIPILIGHFGANPAMVAAIGMLSGYCGTLMTPMAANFNIIPAALLELQDRNLVIKAQLPSGIGILLANLILLYVLI
ncbi:MAG: DUF979 domain-containing protein [Neisseriales bacterium]|nr:MAG: DUF979 domain-containing protein [Neisseriales bacterium]